MIVITLLSKNGFSAVKFTTTVLDLLIFLLVILVIDLYFILRWYIIRKVLFLSLKHSGLIIL